MDELELLKKDWQRQDQVLPKLSYKEIYQLILKKSSSMVRWIFIISIIEFLFWASIDIIARLTNSFEDIEVDGMQNFSIIGMIVSYSILVYFIIRFYKNYKKIQTTDSAKVLMQNILNTRDTVRYYVWINLSLLGLLVISTEMYLFFFTDRLAIESPDKEVPIVLLITLSIVVVLIFVGLFALIYRFVYGILTRKLMQNYEELKKLEL